MIKIRDEILGDYTEIRHVNDRAFDRPLEGRIIDKLRRNCKEHVSLVAVFENKIVGHIFFSPVTIENPAGPVFGMGLAPMAVLPEYQNQGIGTMLVKSGLRMIKNRNYPFVVVLGHEKYYPRFGFKPASQFGLRCQWEGVPDNAFLAIIYDHSVLEGVSGVARYRDEFDEAM